MAVAELIVSRREVLAAGCAACLTRHPELDSGSTSFSARHPGPDPGSTFPSPGPQDRGIPDQVRNDERGDAQSFAVTKWDRALVRYRRAEAALAAGVGADDDLFGRLLGRLNKALGRLLRTPAPHLPALAAKLDLLVSHQVWELNFAQSCLAALRRDVRRLSSRG